MAANINTVFFKRKMQTLLPKPSIAGFVKNIVILEDSNIIGDLEIPLIAKGYPSITFRTTGRSSMNNGVEKDALILYGQNISPFRIRASDHLLVIAYFLFPHVLTNFFGFAGTEVKDLGIDLSEIQPAKGENLKERLTNAAALSIRLNLMDAYILSLNGLSRKNINLPVGYAVSTIQNCRGLIPLKNLQDQLYMTERSFQRLFTSVIGVPPKVYCRICQFQSAFQQLNSDPNSSLSSIAYANGYADQSHMNRAFREFTNCSPSEYLRRSTEF